MDIKKEIIKNWQLVETDILSKEKKYYRNIFPELNIEIRTCLFGSNLNKSIEFVFDKKINLSSKFENIKLKGLTVNILEDLENKEKKFISLKLKNNNLLEIFLELIESIIDEVKFENDKSIIINLIIKKIHVWIKFFKREKFESLSEEEIRGLMGELLFIKKFSANKDGFKKNIYNWKGCENGLHDFDFKEIKAEIKTFAKSGVIHISYAEQLDINKYKEIYLICFNLLKDNGTFSLNELVAEIKSKIDKDLLLIFQDKLKSYGYFDIHKDEYNEKYKNLKEYYFKVDKEFPKILYKDLHNAISKVAYKLDTNLLLSFDIGKKKSEEIFLDEKI